MAYEGNRGTMAPQPEWLTLGQAAKYLGVAQSTMRKWSDLGRVSAFYTPGGHRRYRRADLDQFLDRSGPGAVPSDSPRSGPLVLIVDDDSACASTSASTSRPRATRYARPAARKRRSGRSESARRT
jgi:excisionase family DNA binding protein